jgi:hypothetical protein
MCSMKSRIPMVRTAIHHMGILDFGGDHAVQCRVGRDRSDRGVANILLGIIVGYIPTATVRWGINQYCLFRMGRLWYGLMRREPQFPVHEFIS